MLKTLIKNILSSCGFILMRNHTGFSPEWIPLHDNKIDLLETLVKLELSGGVFKFLQIGANDGIQADPLSVLIRKYNLKGSMIEPIPEVFQKLLNNCDDIKENIDFKNMAITITGSHGLMPFYIFTTADKEQQHLLSGYSSTTKEKLESVKVEANIKADIAMINIPYESVSYYLNNHGIGELNLLVTDVEGLDIDIVSEFIKFGVLPNIIYMEILGQSAAKRMQIIELLAKSGYSIGGNISDLIAYRRIDKVTEC